MEIKNLLKTTGKSLLAIIIGAISGIIISLVYGFQFWFPKQISELSGFGDLFGVVALIPVTIILFGILGIFIGGAAGIIFYWTIKIIKKIKNKNNQKII